MHRKTDIDEVRVSGFGLADDFRAMDSGWHRHRKHQVLYAQEGTLHLEVAKRQWLLPPQRVAWISAGVDHRVKAQGSVVLRTVYLSGPLGSGIPGPCAVFPATLLAREMILHAMRWGPRRNPRDALANQYFKALAALCAEWLEDGRPTWLPTAQSPELDEAMRYTLAHLGDEPSLAHAARAAGLSPRTLARRFAEEAQTTWRKFLQDARLLKAMELLSVPGARVTQTAYAVGYRSLGAFTHAFEAFAGQTPKDYRARVTEPHARGRRSR
ncbi:MAG: helix-turn-helix domain-containing protein [Myxococcota bacterium]